MEELTLKQLPRNEKFPTPALAHVASPSPAKARRRTEKPRLSAADSLGPVKLPSELFAIATSRNSQGDMALTKALDGIQAATTRLETERTKLVIQSQELQIWDMAREEELVLLRAENEQLEQQLEIMSEKISKGLGRDGVLDSLQFALRKARTERDAEVREADALFNQLQEARAAEEELRQLRGALSAALSKLSDEWSVIPLLSDEARELRAKADVAAQDPTNLGHQEVLTLLRGLLTLASRGMELQRETQTLRGEKAALQEALDAAHQQLVEQTEQLKQTDQVKQAGQLKQTEQLKQAGQVKQPSQEDVAAQLAAAAAQRGSALERLGRRRAATHRWSLETGGAAGQQPSGQPHDELVSDLRRQVSELEGKLAEYRSFLEDNQEEIEGLQAELKRLRAAAQPADPQDAAAAHGKPLPHPGSHRGLAHGGSRGATAPAGAAGARQAGGSSLNSGSAGAAAHPFDTSGRRQQLQEQPSAVPGAQQPLAVVGTPTRHVPSISSPISTINYGASPAGAATLSARGSPLHQQPVADIAQKVAELQELALRAAQQAAEREADAAREHETQLEALRQELAQQKALELAAARAQLSQQHARALAQAQAREAELSRQHAQTARKLEDRMAAMTMQHAQAVADLQAQLGLLSAQHAQAVAEAEGRAQAREEELERLRAQVAELEQQAAQLEARSAHALAEQADHLRQQHAQQQQRQLEERLAQALSEQAESLHRRHAQERRQLEELLAQQHAEQHARRDEDARRKHAERLAEQAAQLATLHADQAAQLGVMHAEAVADLEVQLRTEFEQELRECRAQVRAEMEQELQEREDQLASAHAAQLRELEARAAAEAAVAADDREARLQRHFMEQLAQAADQAAELERARALLMDDAARLRQQHQQQVEELLRHLDEQRGRISELEQLLAEQAACAGAVAGAGADYGGTGAAGARPMDDAGNSVGEASRWVEQVAPSDCDAPPGAGPRDACRLRLSQQGEELARLAQQHTHEVQAALDDGERRREEEVMALQRQYVEVVARLGRDHEKAASELRSSHELREANLLRALERQAQEARDAQRKASDRMRELQDQLAELHTLLEKERRQHVTSNEALQGRIDQLASELDTVRQREAQLLRVQAPQHEGASQSGIIPAPNEPPTDDQVDLRRHPHDAHSVRKLPYALQPPAVAMAPVDRVAPAGQGEPPVPDTYACCDEGRSAASGEVAAAAEGVPLDQEGCNSATALITAAFTFGASAAPASDTWPDGQTLLWPQRDAMSHNHATTAVSTSTLSHAPAAAGGGNDAAGASVPTRTGREAPPASALERRGCGEWGRHSDQDLATNLVRVLRVMESDSGPAGGARVWNSSPELDDKKAPRRGLLQSPQQMASSPPVARDLRQPLDEVVGSAGERPALLQGNGNGRGGQAAAWDALPPGETQLLTSSDVTRVGAPLDLELAVAARQAEAATDEQQAEAEEQWGELVGATTDAPAAAAAEGAEAPLVSDPPGTRRGYVSEAATSVSTTSSYNSDTEFYVDDEDDEDLRGTALAAALAQSPRSSQNFDHSPPPMLLEIQQRRRAQSPGPASPVGGVHQHGHERELDHLGIRPQGPEAGRPTSAPPGELETAVVGPQSCSPDGTPGNASAGSSASLSSALRGVDELEATLAGPLPKLTQGLLQGDAGPQAEFVATAGGTAPVSDVSVAGSPHGGAGFKAAVPGAGHGVDLEATLSETFPAVVLLPLLSASASGGVPSADPHDVARTAVPVLEPSGSFTFSSPGRAAGCSDEVGDSSDGASSSGADTGDDGRGESGWEFSRNQLRTSDLVASFDFAASGLSCSSAQAAAGEPSGGVQDADPSANSGSSGHRLPSAGNADDGAGFGGLSPGGAGFGAIDSSPSSSSLSSPSTNPCPSSTAQSPEWAAWAVHDYPGDRALGGAAVSDTGGAAAHGGTPVQLQNPWGDDWPSSYRGAFSGGPGVRNGAEEQDSPGSSGAKTGQGSERSDGGLAVGVVPLMAPNPFFDDDCGEPSPPWSVADWGTAGEGSPSARADEGLTLSPQRDSAAKEVSSNGSHSGGDCGRGADAPGPAAAAGDPDSRAPLAPLGDDRNGPGPSVDTPNQHQLTTPVGTKRTAGFMGWGHARGDAGAGAGTGTDASANGEAGDSGRSDGAGQRDGRDCSSARVEGRIEEVGGEGAGDDTSPGRPPEGQPQRPRSNPYRLALWAAAPDALGDERHHEGDERREEDDTADLLAAGASLSSSERRRRQRRRMDDAPPLPLPSHQVDLLRQSWEFIHGVATPLSPRSVQHHGRVQGHALGHVSPPRLPYGSPRSPSPWSESPGTLAAAGSEELLRQNTLLPLRAFAKSQSASPRSSPRSGVPLSGVGSTGASPAAGAAKLAASAPPAPAGPRSAVDLIAQSSPHTPPAAPPTSSGTDLEGGGISPVQQQQQQQQQRVTKGPASASPVGPLAVALSPHAAASTPGRTISASDVRQRSRDVLERAMSRVADLEGQCRALAASLPLGPAAELAVAMTAAPMYTPQPLPWPAPHSCGPAARALSAGRTAHPSTPGSISMFPTGVMPATADGGGGNLRGITPQLQELGVAGELVPLSPAEAASPLPSPAVAAVVIDALEDLRGDLFELEQLHQLTMRSALTPVPGADGDPAAGPEGQDPEVGVGPGPKRPEGLLLLTDAAAEDAAEAGGNDCLGGERHGVEGGAAAAAGSGAVLGKAPSGGEAEAGASRGRTGLPDPSSGNIGRSVVGAHGAEEALRQPASAALDGPVPPPPLQQHHRCHKEQGLERVREREREREQQAAGALVTPAPAAVRYQESGDGTLPLHGLGVGTGAVPPPLPAHSPPSGGPSSPGLDPTLVSLLQLSIQAQVQGQLGQLQAKIAELQRQNEALLLAATAASTPATPLPFAVDSLQQRGRHAGAGMPLTPLPMPPFTVPTPSPSGSGCGGGFGGGALGAEGGEGTDAARRSASMGTTVLHAMAFLPQVKQGEAGAQPMGLTGDTSASGHTSISVFPGALLMQSIPQPPGTVSPGDVAGAGVVRGSSPAGPYSPEELSQLPPTIQLFAPPQLRAAALAAVHEQQRRTA